ncbi:unnamed protein product, partial [Polarella glacialis]
ASCLPFLKPSLAVAFLVNFPVARTSTDCPMPQVQWSSLAGSCQEARGKSTGHKVPDGSRCIPWCASGYAADEDFLLCQGGLFTPRATFGCLVQETVGVQAPDDLPISRCMEDMDACSFQRLQYSTHLAQAGDWEGIDENWRPKWPPR